MSDNPLERIQAIAGEHFQNYFIVVVHPEMEMEYVYDNVYAARGLIEMTREVMVDTAFDTEDEDEIDWDGAWNDEIDDEDSEF
tara:strand:+ start:1073 stop:1321 length:249 start_codon:yes stop_codon:yes gene_type:complete